jgi:hypothetical protein
MLSSNWGPAMSISFPGTSVTTGFVTKPSSTSSSTSSSSSATQSSSSLGAQSSQDNSIVQQFMQFANMSPAQRMFAQMLNKLGISQDQFNAMSPADQQKVEQQIQQMIKQQAQDNGDKQSGLITDISA